MEYHTALSLPPRQYVDNPVPFLSEKKVVLTLIQPGKIYDAYEYIGEDFSFKSNDNISEKGGMSKFFLKKRSLKEW